MVGIPVVVRASQLEKPWHRSCKPEMPPCGREKPSHQNVKEAYFRECVFCVYAPYSTNFHDCQPLPMALCINQPGHQL